MNSFECNICYDSPKLPVTTPCGHIYWYTFDLVGNAFLIG